MTFGLGQRPKHLLPDLGFTTIGIGSGRMVMAIWETRESIRWTWLGGAWVLTI